MTRRDFLCGLAAASLPGCAGHRQDVHRPTARSGGTISLVEPEPLAIAAGPQLFLNDECIWRMDRLRRKIEHPILKSEEFANMGSARTNGWVEHLSRENENNYGFSESDHNRVGAGEAGGAFTRTSAAQSYYADVFGRRSTLNETATARGKFILATPLTDNRIHVGHLDSTISSVSTANLLGFFVQEPGRIFAAIGLADGTVLTGFLGSVDAGIVYDWDYTYDPLGGDTGNGQITLNMPGLGTGTAVVMLSAEQRAVGAAADAFGLVNPGTGSAATDAGAMFIDNVEYTAVRAPLKIAAIVLTPAGTLRLTINSPAPAQPHVVQETADLATAAWTDVTGVTFGPPAANELTAEFSRPTSSPRFYRVVLRP